MALLGHVRASVMCIPRNLVLLGLSTVAQLMIKGCFGAVYRIFKVCLIIVAEETHHSHVICELKVGVVS